MKILQIFMFLIFLASFTKAQECGYTKLTIFLTDSKGGLVKNAEVKTFDSKFAEEDFLHYPIEEDNYDNFRKKIIWLEEKQAYFGSEGMCGGHRNVGLRISAKGFDTFDKVIDLPLGQTTYSIKLKRKNTKEVSTIEKIPHISGKISDENDAGISFVDFRITDKNGKQLKTQSNKFGYFEIDLPSGNYTFQISKTGFRSLKLIDFQSENTSKIYLDLLLKVRGCDDCNGDILGENKTEDRKEVVLDYQIIKRKNNK